MTERLDREPAGNHFDQIIAELTRTMPVGFVLFQRNKWRDGQWDDPNFVLLAEWSGVLCKSPEYRLALRDPQMFWLKKDRDAWKRRLLALREKGHIIW